MLESLSGLGPVNAERESKSVWKGYLGGIRWAR